MTLKEFSVNLMYMTLPECMTLPEIWPTTIFSVKLMHLCTMLVFDGIKKSLSEIKISYFCDNEIRVQVLNTAQFAEVYFLIQNFENHVTLAFCTLLQCFLK